MRTSERECLEALREAAAILGKSPTKAEYEELGLRPASATIIRVVGGWNEAKERASLETNPSRGSRVGPKPDDVELPSETEWEDLSVDQRWHYRNTEWNKERTLQRRARLRSWTNECKRKEGCDNCGDTRPAVLDFHHENPAEKELAIVEMITYGFGRDTLHNEMVKCTVLCANCHRSTHIDWPAENEAIAGSEASRAWVYRYKQSSEGCSRCGETDPRCLVFHHVRGDKRMSVSRMVSDGYARSAIADEIEKCELLCANCHRMEHFEPPSCD